MKTVLVAGYFDPLHDGHLDHIMKAAKLGDYLYIITHSDMCTKNVKGDCYTSLYFREFMLRAIMAFLGVTGTVIITLSEDVASVIKIFRPDIFAKGGDRTADNMPLSEVKACGEVGCQIIYGVGDQLNRSSAIKNKIKQGGTKNG